MGFLKKISSLISPAAPIDENAFWITVKCHRCGENIRSRIDLRNDLSLEFSEQGSASTYFCRKILMGAGGHCFQRVEVELTFDSNRRLISKEIHGGQFID